MPAIYIRDDGSLEVNPPVGNFHLTSGGSDWLWAVCAVYTFSFLVLWALSFRPRQGEKIFHYLFIIGLLAGAVTYYSMASNLGYSELGTTRTSGETFQMFFAKYINWVVIFPVLIIALGLISGVSWTSIFYNVTLSWVWVISYLCGAYTRTSYKWGFFAFGTAAWAILAFETLTAGRTLTRRGAETTTTTTTTEPAAVLLHRRHYTVLAGWLNLLWLLYPIAWGLSMDGGREISVVKGFVFFGVLDVLLLPVLAFATWFLSRRWDYGQMNLHFTQYGRVASGSGYYPEKGPVTASGAGVKAPAPAATATV